MQRTTLFKYLLLLHALVHGVSFWLGYNDVLAQQWVLVSIAFFGVIAAFWLMFDAQEHQLQAQPSLIAATLILPIVGVPIYLHQNQRSFKNFFKFLGVMLVIYIAGTFIPDILGWT